MDIIQRLRKHATFHEAMQDSPDWSGECKLLREAASVIEEMAGCLVRISDDPERCPERFMLATPICVRATTAREMLDKIAREHGVSATGAD